MAVEVFEMGWLALTFLSVTSLEIFLLLQIGDWLGFWPTLAFVLTTAIVGAYLAKREGLRVFRDWQRALAEMRIPEEGITSGLLVLVGAVLLCTPGVLTDLTGIALLIPPVRRVVARFLETQVKARMEKGGTSSVFDFRVVTARGAYGRRRVVDVEGEVIEDREIRARAPIAEEDVIEGEVVDARTRRLEPGE
ncbi:MAG: FxsA family protein [Myxococcota bacterium]|nr:FxsA family protein [Myxococcota bacterium]